MISWSKQRLCTMYRVEYRPQSRFPFHHLHFATQEINTKVTLSPAHKQFATPPHPVFSFSYIMDLNWINCEFLQHKVPCATQDNIYVRLVASFPFLFSAHQMTKHSFIGPKRFQHTLSSAKGSEYAQQCHHGRDIIAHWNYLNISTHQIIRHANIDFIILKFYRYVWLIIP